MNIIIAACVILKVNYAPLMLRSNVLKLLILRGLLYSGSVDCLVKTVRQEGFLALYKGLLPIWTRMVRNPNPTESCNYLRFFLPATVHTTYIDIASRDFSYINMLYQAQIFPYLFVIIVISIDNLSLLFSSINISNIRATGQKRPSDKKTISFMSLSLYQCLMLMCYIAN